MRARSRPTFRWLLLAAVALATSLALTASAGAQEVPALPGTEQPPGSTGDQPADSGTPPDPVTVPPDPAPDPPPPPEPAPTPPPEMQAPDANPAQPASDQIQPVGKGDSVTDRSGASHSPSLETPTTTFTVTPEALGPGTAPGDSAAATTAPLGWDVYDDALFAETVPADNDTGAGAGGGAPPAIGGFRALGNIVSAAESEKQHDAEPVSQAESKSAGGSGPGGTGPGPGQSLGLFGAAGGSGAGMALLTLLGLASGWFLLAPNRKRAFLASTATWRPSAYVPPIEHPG